MEREHLLVMAHELVEREAKYKGDANNKAEEEHTALAKEHHEALKLQEELFAKTKEELQAEVDSLRKRLQEAEAARDQAQATKASIEGDLVPLQMQVGGASDVTARTEDERTRELG